MDRALGGWSSFELNQAVVVVQCGFREMTGFLESGINSCFLFLIAIMLISLTFSVHPSPKDEGYIPWSSQFKPIFSSDQAVLSVDLWVIGPAQEVVCGATEAVCDLDKVVESWTPVPKTILSHQPLRNARVFSNAVCSYAFGL